MATKKAGLVRYKERPVNAQNPFSYNQSRGRINLRPSRTELPASIIALCTYCGWWYQKLPKIKVPNATMANCGKCFEKAVIALPTELLPWRLLNNRPTPFRCAKCSLRFYSWSMFGSLCGHKAHKETIVVCRLCCRKVKVIPASVNSLEPNAPNQIAGVTAGTWARPARPNLFGDIQFITYDTILPPELQQVRVVLDAQDTHIQDDPAMQDEEDE